MRKHFEIEDVLRNFSGEDSLEMLKYMDEVVFLESRYIFTTREGHKQYGYCTHCHSKFETDGVRHNSEVTCPECGSSCTVKASGYGRKAMIDEAYFVWYEKSAINPEAIVARGIYAVRDYRGEYYDIKTRIKDVARYVFKPGGSMAIKRYTYFKSWHDCYIDGRIETCSWSRCSSIYSETNKDHLAHVPFFSSDKSIKKAALGTSFSWSGWEKYSGDLVEFFGLYSKWPCIEYLNILGLDNLVKEKLAGGRTYSMINWRGENLTKVLKISKEDVNEIRESDIPLSFFGLKVYDDSKKNGYGLTITEACHIADAYSFYYEELKEMIKYSPIKKIVRFLHKQYKKWPDNYRWESSVFSTWKDYIKDCKELNMNLNNDKVLFPSNVYRAHQNTIKKRRIKADRKLNEQIKKRLKDLNKYRFKFMGLLVRPANSSNELIYEGKKLNHCVGNYAYDYAKGRTVILLVRKANKPGKPYFTVEVRNGHVYQIRGKDNCKPDERVEEFIEEFKVQRLGYKREKMSA